MVAIYTDESLYAVRWLFRIFPFRKLYLIPQVFSASHIPQNTRGQHSAFRNPQSILARIELLLFHFPCMHMVRNTNSWLNFSERITMQ